MKKTEIIIQTQEKDICSKCKKKITQGANNIIRNKDGSIFAEYCEDCFLKIRR